MTEMDKSIRPTLFHLIDWLETSLKDTPISHELRLIVRQKILVRIYDDFLKIRREQTFSSIQSLYQFFEDTLKIDKRRERMMILTSIFYAIAILVFTLLFWRSRRFDQINLLFSPPVDLRTPSKRDNLYGFLSASRFDFNTSPTYIVEDRKISFRGRLDKKVYPVFSIDLYLISILSLKERSKLIARLISQLVLIIRLIKSYPMIGFSNRDFLLSVPCAQSALDKGLVCEILLTNSNYLFQPPISYLRDEKVKLYMLWYSDNSFPKYSNNELSGFDYLAFGLAQVDCHFVWTKEFAAFLSQFTVCPVKPVGSILFYDSNLDHNLSKQVNSFASPQNTFDLLIFDVTPFKEPNNNDYYREIRCLEFLLGVADLYKELCKVTFPNTLIVGIKPKRKPRPRHSRRYLSTVDRLIRENKGWEKLPEDSNLYNLISNSKLIIAIPFTSPAIVASELGIPCCFLDLGSDPTDIPSYADIPVMRSSRELLDFAWPIFST